MTYFSNNDPIWEETAAFLAPLIKDTSLVAGPESFVNVLPNVLAYDLLSRFTPDFFDFVLIHKGECLDIGAKNLEAWERHYSAIFANAVFVVFAKEKLPEIDRKDNDFKSLVYQIKGLPDAPPAAPSNPASAVAGEDQLDYRPVIRFLQDHCSDQPLILAPPTICKVLPRAMDEEAVLKTSLDTVSIAVVSVCSALNFPYQDLKNIAESYMPVYSDTFFAVFSKNTVSPQHKAGGEFTEVLQKAMQHEDYLVSLKLYRDMVLGN